jgi:hypothetical protein
MHQAAGIWPNWRRKIERDLLLLLCYEMHSRDKAGVRECCEQALLWEGLQQATGIWPGRRRDIERTLLFLMCYEMHTRDKTGV